MKRELGCAVAVLSVLFEGALCGQELQPFTVSWDEKPGLVDLSFLLDRPAGKDGFITVKEGHLVTGAGKRIRFWGVNFSGQGCLPPKEHAPIIARRLASLGVNCVRFHFFDRPAPNGIIDSERDDTRQLDPQQLDRLDWMIFQLKEHGIYTDLNLNVARTYKKGDGVKDYEYLGFAKGLTYFDPRLLELQKEYARLLLTHRNPYTGNEYRVEPAVAIVEFVNENSLVEAWMDGRLQGLNTRKNPGTWTDITASYAEDLTRLYNEWLEKNVAAEIRQQIAQEAGVQPGQMIPRLRPGQFREASPVRFHTEARFYMDIERRYFLEMRRYLREELGVKSLLVGNSDHGHGHSGYPIVVGTSLLDIVDGHVYWQHPSYIEDPVSRRRIGFRIPNTPMVLDPLHSTVVQLARTPVLGKPYTVSEVNHPFPHEFACEGIPILAAYAAFQDWDGIFWYTLAHREIVNQEPRIAGHFDLAFDPVKMTQLAVGALAFLRGDIRPATNVVARSYSAEQVRESIRLRQRDLVPFFTPGFLPALPLKHAVRVSSFEGPPFEALSPIAENPIVSDTGEIAWWTQDTQAGLVVIDSPRWKGVIGHLGKVSARPATLAVDVTNSFAAVIMCSLDGEPLDKSHRLLISAAAKVENSGQKWNSERTSLEEWGQAPTVIEVVKGELVWQRGSATRVTVQPLDANGRPFGTPLEAEKSTVGWKVRLGDRATTWYLVTVTE